MLGTAKCAVCKERRVLFMASEWASGSFCFLWVGETVQQVHSPEMSTSNHSSYSSFPLSAHALLKSLLSSFSCFSPALPPFLCYRSRVLFSSKFFSHFSRSFSFVSIKIIYFKKENSFILFSPPTFSSSSFFFLKKKKLFPNYLQEEKKKKNPAALPVSQFFCSKDKRSFRIREEGGKAKKKIPVKNLHQGQKPDWKALFEGNVKRGEEGIGN